MTVLIASSGGAESPAIIFFLIHITIASLLLPHQRGFLYVTLAPALVGLVALLEYSGVIAHVAIVQPVRYREPLYISAVLLFFAAACYVMAYSCMTIARRLRRREHELGGLYDGVRDVTSTLEITDRPRPHRRGRGPRPDVQGRRHPPDRPEPIARGVRRELGPERDLSGRGAGRVREVRARPGHAARRRGPRQGRRAAIRASGIRSSCATSASRRC